MRSLGTFTRRDLRAELGVSKAAVAARIKEAEDDGVIGLKRRAAGGLAAVYVWLGARSVGDARAASIAAGR